MAISLTTDGLDLEFRDRWLTEVSGAYPIGTVIAARANLTLPGTWLAVYASGTTVTYTNIVPNKYAAIRVA